MSIRGGARNGFGRSNSIKLYENTLVAAGKFDITGIPLGFRVMEIFGEIRSDVSATNDTVLMFFNNDTTLTNYRSTRTASGTGGVTSGSSDDPRISVSTGATAPANYFSPIWIFINQYAGSGINKTAMSKNSRRQDATTLFDAKNVVHWENTAAINQITIQTDNDPTDELIADSWMQIWLYR